MHLTFYYWRQGYLITMANETEHFQESISDKLRNLPGMEIKEGPKTDLVKAIAEHEKAEGQKSWLDKTVELVYSADKQSLQSLKELERQATQNEAKGDTVAQARLAQTAKEAIEKDKKAVAHQQEVNFYATGFLKAVPLFAMTKGKVLFEGAAPSKGTVMLAASIGVHAAGQVKVSDQGSDIAINAALGGAKGFALKQTFDYLGPRQILGASRGEYSNMAAKGVLLGGSSRLYDTTLNQNTYRDLTTGQVSIGKGLETIAATTLEPRAVAFDATLFMGAHGAFKGLSNVAGRAVEASPVLSKAAQSPVANFLREGQVGQNAGMGATFGFASGGSSELIRQRQAGEDLNISEIIRKGALQSLTDAAAGATGATGVAATRAVGHMKLEIPVPRPMTPPRTFAGEETPLIPPESAPVNAGEVAKPQAVAEAAPANERALVEPVVGETAAKAPAEQVAVSDPARVAEPVATAERVVEPAKAPAAVEETVKVDLAGQNGPHVETPLEAAAQPKGILSHEAGIARKASYEMSAAQKPIFEEGIRLLGGVFSGRATASDVTQFLEYGATRGQAVKAQLEQMAGDYKELGNVRAQRLLEVAINNTPENIALAEAGYNLARAAGQGERFGPEHQQLIEFAYGQGRGAQEPVRVLSELIGDPPTNQVLGEVYAGANGLMRGDGVQPPIDYSKADPQAKDFLEAITAHQPTNAAEHNNLVKGVSDWADYFYNDHGVLHQLGRTTPYGVIASAVDAKLGTDYFGQFPKSHVIERPPIIHPTPIAPVAQGVDLAALGEAAKPTPGVVKDIDAVVGEPLPAAVDKPIAPEQATQPAPETRTAEQARDTTNVGPAVDHTPGNMRIYPERLFGEFENTQGPMKQSRAHLLADHIGQLTDAQFVKWLEYLYQPAQGTSGATNLQRMGLPGSHILARPEIQAVVTNPERAAIDVTTLKNLMSQPAKLQSGDLPEEIKHHIAYRLDYATQQQRLALDTNPETANAELNWPKILRDAIPSWYAKTLRDNYSTRNADGRYEYPKEFDQNLALWLEIGREADMASPKYKEYPPQRNSLTDRMAVLEQAMAVRNAQNAPAVDRVLQLAGQDQPAAKGLLSKFDGTTNAPETAELIGLVAANAQTIADVKTVMDAVHFGKKADSDSFKGRKDGRDTSQSDKARDANQSLAQSVLTSVMVPGSPAHLRAQQLVNDMISGKIRDPRPDMPDRPGFGSPRPGGDRGGAQGRDNNRGPRRDNAEPVAPKPAAPVEQPPFTRPVVRNVVPADNQQAVAPEATPEVVPAAASEAVVKTAPVEAQRTAPEPTVVVDQTRVVDTTPAQTVADPVAAEPSLRQIMTGEVTAQSTKATDPAAAADTAGGASQVDKFNQRYAGQARPGRRNNAAEEEGDDGMTPQDRGRKREKPRGRGQVLKGFDELGKLRGDDN